VVLLAVGVLLLLVVPSSAQAATCSNYDNQADAQRAQDTRDGDGDGIFCEALPCPCSKPGQSSASAPKPKSSKPATARRVRRYVARITKVVDGNTIKVRLNGGRREMRQCG